MMRVSGQKVLESALSLAHRTSPAAVKTGADLVLIVLAAVWTWFVSFSQVSKELNPWPFLTVVVLARLLIYRALQIWQISWTHVSRHDVLWLVVSAALGAPAIALLFLILPDPFSMDGITRPPLILATEAALYTLMLGGARVVARTLAEGRRRRKEGHRRLLIVGAGAAGRALAFQIQESSSDYEIVGFVDDDTMMLHRTVRGLPVLGTVSELPALVKECEVQEIVVAIPSLSPERLRECLRSCQDTGLPVRILPPLRQLIGARPDFMALRDVQMEDLLPRPEVKLDRAAVNNYVAGRTVMVTGGGGSIGGELCRQALDAGASRLLVLGRGENSVFEMAQELIERRDHLVKEGGERCEIVPVICDVRDRPALESVFRRFLPQVVFHAAAHKHVPLMEAYPCEAVKNNVLGTLNLVELCGAGDVERLVMVSTDKAVNPANVMGASKRIGEMIVKGYAAKAGANMVCVRFGNVLGSRGSVVRTMQSQIRRRLPVTVTDPEMVRYFMTIPEAVQLVLQAGAQGGCGEVFVLDMGHPVRILDLAYDLIRLSGLVPNQDIPIRIIGRRPGEKMYEDLLTSTEMQGAEKRGPFFVAPPQQIDYQVLLGSIKELSEAADSGDNARVLALIQKLVPAFHPDGRAESNGGPPPNPKTDKDEQNAHREDASLGAANLMMNPVVPGSTNGNRPGSSSSGIHQAGAIN